MSTLSKILEKGFQEEVVVLSKNLQIKDANDYFFIANQITAEQVIDKPCYEFLTGCKKLCRDAHGECPMHEVMSTGEKVTVSLTDVELGDSKKHFIIDVYPVPDQDNFFFLHISRDVTQKVNQERMKEEMWSEILNRMEQLYAAMIQSHQEIDGVNWEINHLTEILPLAMVWWDSDAKITKANPSAEILFGKSIQSLIDTSFTSLFASGDSQNKCQVAIEKALKGHSMGYTLTENRSDSGHLMFCEWFHTPLQQAPGSEITGGLSFGQDVSARFQMQEALTKVQQQLSATSKATHDAIVMVNSLGRITSWNLAAENMFGWFAKDIIDQEAEKLFPIEKRNEQRSFLRGLIAGGKIDSEKKTIQTRSTANRRDGTVFPVLIDLVRENIGDRPTLIATFQDLTEIQHQDTIIKQSEELKAIGRMAGGLAHRVNDLLTAFYGTIELIESDVQSEESRQALDRLLTIVSQNKEACQALLRRDGEQDDNDELPLNLTAIIQKVINESSFYWKDVAQKEGNTIAIETDFSKISPVAGKIEELKELFSVLLLNAIDGLPQGGKIKISASQTESSIQITFEDNGIGIRAEDLDLIFNPYFTTKGGGHAGLGLSLAETIAQRYAGKIDISSIYGAGTVTTVHLPLDKPDVGKIRPEARYAQKVLLMEDEETIRHLASKFLTDAGYQVLLADNGMTGLQLLDSESFDLVITDQGMPVMGGQEVAARIRRDHPGLPIIMLSAWGKDLDTSQMAASGVNTILNKPFSSEELIALVDAILA